MRIEAEQNLCYIFASAPAGTTVHGHKLSQADSNILIEYDANPAYSF
jgi:hypothetical protein